MCRGFEVTFWRRPLTAIEAIADAGFVIEALWNQVPCRRPPNVTPEQDGTVAEFALPGGAWPGANQVQLC